VRTVELFAHGHMLLGTLDFHRRSHIRGMLGDELETRGLFGGVRSILGLRGLVEDPLVAAPFLALGELPAGTLGRAFFTHYREHGFTFPGEKGGFPESGVYHDFVHVLAGYGTDPLGELQVGGFTAGFRKQDPLFVAMLPLLVFCADINVTPIPHDQVDQLFAQPGVAEKFLHAVERGERVKIDLSDKWDFWPHVAKPLAEVREELGIS
jgi:ubiquinone biosynthesis protein Coq4